jgi:hypothetical protein
MKDFLANIRSLFADENGNVSMKRLCGLFCTIALCVTLYSNSFSEAHFAPSATLVDAVALLAFGCLGLSSVDKIWGNKNNKKADESSDPE